MNDLTQTFAVSGPDNKPQVFNSGVARITGINLLANGKLINWLYLIADIGCLAVFENQGRNVWLGADGIAVAGDTSILTSLVPREGQRFYNIQTSQPLQYKGGAWGGATWADFQVLSPTTVIVTADYSFVPQRDYVIFGSGLELTLPDENSAVNGHLIRAYVAPGSIDCTVLASGTTEIIFVGSGAETQAELNEGIVYDFVFYDGDWYSFSETAVAFLKSGSNLSDLNSIEEARENLQVLSVEETLTYINSIDRVPNSGLTITGAVGTASPRMFGIEYASATEIASGLAVNKPIKPAELQDALDLMIANAQSVSKYTNVTGLYGNSRTFTITVNSSTELGWTACQAVFNTDPTLLTADTTVLDVIAGVLTVPTAAGYNTYVLKVNTLGVVSIDYYGSKLPTEVILGYVVTNSGSILWALPAPQVSTSDYYLRGVAPVITGGVLSANAVTAGRLDAASAVLSGESLNWTAFVPDANVLAQASASNILLTYFRPNGVVVSVNNTHIDGRLLADGSVVPVAKFTIQTVYRDFAGNYFVQVGADLYDSVVLAAAGIGSVVLSPLSSMSAYLRPVCHMIVKGDQYQGSGTLNLLLATNFKVYPYGAGSGAGGTAAGTQEAREVIAAGELEYGQMYVFSTNDPIDLPPGGLEGGYVSFRVTYPFRPELNVNTVGELISDSSRVGREAASLTCNNYKTFQTLVWLNGKWRY